jgi:hypothetical protein
MNQPKFIPNSVIQDIAKEVQASFIHGSLFSQSSILEIAEAVQQSFDDRGLQPRRSAVLMTAKIAKAMFLGTIDHTKQTISRISRIID